MTKEELINKWEWCQNMDNPDSVRWGIVFDYKDELKRIGAKVNIDNDDVFISFEDEEEMDEPTCLLFDEFGFYALFELLKSQKINADYV